MEIVCGFCHEAVGDDRPKLELFCHHFFHTDCFLTNMGDECATCGVNFIRQLEHPYGEEEEEEEETAQQEATERTRVHALWDSNATFRSDIKKYMAASRGLNKHYSAFRKIVVAKKRDLAEIYVPMKLRLEGLYATKKDEIMNTEEYKTYRSAFYRPTRAWTLLQQKYTLHRHSIQYLQEKQGCRRLQRPRRRWSSSPGYMIRRAIRFRLSSCW